jgi:hypothetical protein
MTYDLATQKYEDLSIELVDEHDGVTVIAGDLFVHGRLFAFLIDDDLAVDLPVARSTDLVGRDVAVPYVRHEHPDREWVRVSDLELWPELAREAHEYVGEPRVGGQS